MTVDSCCENVAPGQGPTSQTCESKDKIKIEEKNYQVLQALMSALSVHLHLKIHERDHRNVGIAQNTDLWTAMHV